MSIEDEPRKRRSAANAGKAWATLIPTKKVLHDEDEVEEEGPGTKSQDALTASGSPRKARIQEDDEDYEGWLFTFWTFSVVTIVWAVTKLYTIRTCL